MGIGNIQVQIRESTQRSEERTGFFVLKRAAYSQMQTGIPNDAERGDHIRAKTMTK